MGKFGLSKLRWGGVGGQLPFSVGVKGYERCAEKVLKSANPIKEEGMDIIETQPAIGGETV